MNLIGSSPNGMGIANSVILMNLFDYLLANNMIRPHDVRAILNKAADELTPLSANIAAKDAISVIRDRMIPTFEKSLKKN